MSYLKLNGTDVSHLVRGLKIGYETLVSENSGRNAKGDTVIDVVNRKVKLYVSFIPMDGSDMASLLSAISPYVIDVTYRDSRTNSMNTIKCYTGTPTPDYYCILNNKVFYNSFELNFIEL